MKANEQEIFKVVKFNVDDNVLIRRECIDIEMGVGDYITLEADNDGKTVEVHIFYDAVTEEQYEVHEFSQDGKIKGRLAVKTRKVAHFRLVYNGETLGEGTLVAGANLNVRWVSGE